MKYAMQTNAVLGTSVINLSKSVFRGVRGSAADEKSVLDGSVHAIRIYTLGRFSIAIDGQAFHQKGKAQHRPLALLKALIAMGGRDITSNHLCECLWPDSEGDSGARNLAVTVHRLRALLRSKTAVVSDNGKLSLCPRICWVDAWEFERLANSGLHTLDDVSAATDSVKQLRQALGMYSGCFLARESEDPWIFAPRIRLKAKFERLVIALVKHLEAGGRYTDAIDLCLQALERDPFNEMLYRRLIVIYLKNGELAQAARIYTHCREALCKGLAISPSAETERLYLEEIRGHGILKPVQPPAPAVQLVGIRAVS